MKTLRPAPAADDLIDDAACTRTSDVLEFVGRRWTGAVMLALARGATRFGEVRALVDGVSPRMLSVRLRELEERLLVERIVTPTTPVSVEYRLSPRGRELLGVLHALHGWSERWEPGRR